MAVCKSGRGIRPTPRPNQAPRRRTTTMPVCAMKKELNWLNRSLFQGPHLALVTNQKQFDAALRHLKLKDCGEYCTAMGDATTHTYIDKSNRLCVIVGLRSDKAKKADFIEVVGLLVHEAVHVWQEIRSRLVYAIDPSRTGGLEAEFEAYAIQNIAQNLVEAYEKQVLNK